MPMPISALITSPDLTAILCANSATVMVSGTNTSCTMASVGALNACCASSSPWCLCLPLGARQPGLPAVMSPRVFNPRFLFSASVHSLLLPLPFLASLPNAGFAAPSLATGLCKVPSDNLAAFSLANSASATRLASSSKRFCANSCFLRRSSACMAAKVECLLASCSRKAISSAPSKSLRLMVLTGASATTGSSSGAISASSGSTSGTSSISTAGASSSTSAAALAASVAAASMAALSKGCSMTRFFLISTWMVRALPVLSVFLISELDLRVKVILFFGANVPCSLRK